mmetsp:Transcript_51985/g.62533  ORF Transcript_51985/g.62533 Transcript_51985/m.62533 type:complete len:248 (+) Transcript_51985:1696-2439(+)
MVLQWRMDRRRLSFCSRSVTFWRDTSSLWDNTDRRVVSGRREKSCSRKSIPMPGWVVSAFSRRERDTLEIVGGISLEILPRVASKSSAVTLPRLIKSSNSSLRTVLVLGSANTCQNLKIKALFFFCLSPFPFKDCCGVNVVSGHKVNTRKMHTIILVSTESRPNDSKNDVKWFSTRECLSKRNSPTIARTNEESVIRVGRCHRAFSMEPCVRVDELFTCLLIIRACFHFFSCFFSSNADDDMLKLLL